MRFAHNPVCFGSENIMKCSCYLEAVLDFVVIMFGVCCDCIDSARRHIYVDIAAHVCIIIFYTIGSIEPKGYKQEIKIRSGRLLVKESCKSTELKR